MWLAALLRNCREWGRKLAVRLAGWGWIPVALAVVFLLAGVLLWIPRVRENLISLGSVLARHDLNAPHWQEEFKRWRRVFSVLAVILLCVVRLRPDGVRVPGKAGMVGKAQGLLLAFVAVSCAFRNRNWLLPAAMYSMPVEKRLVSEEQPFYVYVALEGDQCGDAELPCTPEYCFTDRLRLFDIDDMGKGFYIKK